MLLCGGDQVLFGLYSLAVIGSLVGGLQWLKGIDKKNMVSVNFGIFCVSAATLSFVLAVLVNIYKCYNKTETRNKTSRISRKVAAIIEKKNQLPEERHVQTMDVVLADCLRSFQVLENGNNKITPLDDDTVSNISSTFTDGSDVPVIDKGLKAKVLRSGYISPPTCYSNSVFRI